MNNTKKIIYRKETIMKTDIEIAQEATLLPIKEVAANIGIKEDDLELYGKYKAKFDSWMKLRITKMGNLFL